MVKRSDLQHLEMTEVKKELRTTENDSGIFESFTPHGTPDGKRARSASKPKDEEDFGSYYSFTSEGTTRGKRARNAALMWILDIKCVIISYILNIISAIALIVLVVKLYQEKLCPICAPCVNFVCPESWIIYEGKYFYVSKKEANWSTSSDICSSFNTSLAVIATQKELDFCANILVPDHWFGLRKEDQVWKLPSGTEFTNQFPVEGEGLCAYVNGKGASSTVCSVEKRFLCSYPEDCRKA